MKKYRIKRIFIKWAVLALGLAFILPALWGVIYNSIRIYSLKARKRALEIENKRLKIQISQTSDDEYVEGIARVKLGLKKPNEIEYRFISDSDKTFK